MGVFILLIFKDGDFQWQKEGSIQNSLMAMDP